MSNVPANASFGSQFKNNMQTGVSLNLSIPIFNKFQVRSQVQTAQLDVENSKIEMDKTKLDLRKNIEQAYYNAIAARNRWDSAQKSVKASEESYRFASQKFEAGKANQYEANQAKTNLTQAISEQTQAKYEYAFRLKILELMK
jgi:outer membrane protein